MSLLLPEPAGQSWTQVVELTEALVFAAVIGLERELRQKSAGLRTHSLIGFGAALMTQVSKYGFGDVLTGHVVLDPSRVAAQIVSGIGFLGGGLIFVKRDIVRGLTTAASVWLTTAVGMAAGAGLPVLAGVTIAGYFLVLYVLPPLVRRAHRTYPYTHHIEVVYDDGQGLLRDILTLATSRGWLVEQLATRSLTPALDSGRPNRNRRERPVGPAALDTGATPRTGLARPAAGHLVSVVIALRGTAPYPVLAADISELAGVHSVTATDPDDDDPDDPGRGHTGVA